MEKEEKICVLARYGESRYVVQEYRPSECWKDIYQFFSTMSRMSSRKAEAILDYDLSGRKEPLYDNTGNPAKWTYSSGNIRKMHRIR